MQNERESALRAAEKIQQSYEQFKFKAKEHQEQVCTYLHNPINETTLLVNRTSLLASNLSATIVIIRI